MGTLWTNRTLRTFGARIALRACWPLRTSQALRPLQASLTLGTCRPYNSLRTLGTGIAVSLLTRLDDPDGLEGLGESFRESFDLIWGG